MSKLVTCINCAAFAYRYEDQRGSIVYYVPESVPPPFREALRQQRWAELEREMERLRALSLQLECTITPRQEDGSRVSLEPGYEKSPDVPLSEYLRTVYQLATTPRQCPGYVQYQPGLSLQDHKDLLRRRQIEERAQLIELRRIASQLEVLSQDFQSLEQMDRAQAQERGYRFQDFIYEVFNVFHLRPHKNIVVPGQQIDVTALMGHQFFLIEARWLSQPVKAKDIRDFYGKLRTRSPFIVGLFWSASGFTEGALEEVKRLASDRVILPLTISDLRSVLSGQVDLRALLGDSLRKAHEYRFELP